MYMNNFLDFVKSENDHSIVLVNILFKIFSMISSNLLLIKIIPFILDLLSFMKFPNLALLIFSMTQKICWV